MTALRVLLDTAFIVAINNSQDQWHAAAKRVVSQTRNAAEVYVTEAVLIESANFLSMTNREKIVGFIGSCQTSSNTYVISSPDLFSLGLRLYTARPDKTWSLTDCISFVVMQRESITLAATSDHHFVQAGFRAMMLEDGADA
jgi:predicted nucleic acid-binding protein